MLLLDILQAIISPVEFRVSVTEPNISKKVVVGCWSHRQKSTSTAYTEKVQGCKEVWASLAVFKQAITSLIETKIFV